jgi:O-antigen/teichoic acid export membrane protein
MKQVHKNVLANYAARLWGIASVFLFVPFYVRLLGVEAYAIISFQAMILSVLYMADAGLAAAFTRETARIDDRQYLADLLKTLERVYLGICVALAAFLMSVAPAIATRWLKADSMGAADVTRFVVLIGIGVPLQIFMTLYHGGLMGLQRQAAANALQVGFSAMRSGLVILPLLVTPSLYVYFGWQVASGVAFLALYRWQTWRAIGARDPARVRWGLLKGIHRFALGMMGMAGISALNTQIDKLVTSKMLPLKDFAYYSLAQTLSQAPVLLTLPIAVAVLPSLTRLSEAREDGELALAYRRASFAIAGLASIVGALLFVFPQDLVYLWTRNEQVAVAVPGIVRILVAGTVFLAFQLMPYHLSIANGHNATNLRLGAISVVCMVPGTVWSIDAMGLTGAAVPWLVMNVLAFVILGYLLTNRFLPGRIQAWFGGATLVPLAVCATLGGAAAWLRAGLALRGLAALALAGATGAVMLLLLGLVYRHSFVTPLQGKARA